MNWKLEYAQAKNWTRASYRPVPPVDATFDIGTCKFECKVTFRYVSRRAPKWRKGRPRPWWGIKKVFHFSGKSTGSYQVTWQEDVLPLDAQGGPVVLQPNAILPMNLK